MSIIENDDRMNPNEIGSTEAEVATKHDRHIHSSVIWGTRTWGQTELNKFVVQESIMRTRCNKSSLFILSSTI